MAIVTPVEADVRLQQGGAVQSVQFGEAVTVGAYCYISTVDGKAYLSSNLSEGEAYISGVSMSNVALDEYGILTLGLLQPVDLGVAATVGQLYVLSSTPGKIMPYGDLTTNDWICYASLGDSSGLFSLRNEPQGLQKV